VLDVEKGAATLADCPVWAKAAKANYESVARPGQRSPAIYASSSNISGVINALIAGGVDSGIGLYVANWSTSQADAEAIVNAGSGPFPVIGYQFANGPEFDSDVFSQSWLNKTSHVVTDPGAKSGWLKLDGSIPGEAGLMVFFNHANQTLGYHKTNGAWNVVPLP
ncbi:MAG: hypothetical protein ACREHG_04165, partial [Candidatus Saccharimonadales bacterium]